MFETIGLLNCICINIAGVVPYKNDATYYYFTKYKNVIYNIDFFFYDKEL